MLKKECSPCLSQTGGGEGKMWGTEQKRCTFLSFTLCWLLTPSFLPSPRQQHQIRGAALGPRGPWRSWASPPMSSEIPLHFQISLSRCMEYKVLLLQEPKKIVSSWTHRTSFLVWNAQAPSFAVAAFCEAPTPAFPTEMIREVLVHCRILQPQRTTGLTKQGHPVCGLRLSV